MRTIAMGWLLIGLVATSPAWSDAPAAMGSATSYFSPLARAPLDTPLVVTGGFGEFREGHFHAGVDLSTGGRVGKPS